MLKQFIDRFKNSDKQDENIATFNDSETRLAVAAILVHAARVDHDYAQTEQTLISSILAHIYKLRPEQADALRTEGEVAEDECAGTFRFTHTLKLGLPESDRLTVLEGLWSVILSDEERHEQEDVLMRKLVEMLGLSDLDSATARQRVEAAMNS